jgi:hypothetical protein
LCDMIFLELADRLKYVESVNKKFMYFTLNVSSWVHFLTFMGYFSFYLMAKNNYATSPDCLRIHTIHLPCRYMICPHHVQVNYRRTRYESSRPKVGKSFDNTLQK